jgi:hypothetical protein
MSNDRLFNFAASRGYSSKNLDSLLTDVRGEGRQATPPPPAAPAAPRVESKGYDGIATTAEKRAAGGGSGGSLSGSKAFGKARDKCKRGKSCGATCIFYRKDCILQLPETVQGEIRKVRGYLLSQVRSGDLTVREANKRFKQYAGLDQPLARPAKRVPNAIPEELKKGTKLGEIKERTQFLKEGVEGMKKDFPDPRERRAKMGEMIKTAFDVLYGKKDVAPGVSVAGMEKMASKEYQDKFKDLAGIYDKYKTGGYKSAEEFSKALQPFVDWYRSRDIKDSEVHFMMGLMPPQVFTYLKGAGSSNIPGSFGSITPRGNVIPGGAKMSAKEEARAQTFLLMKIAMQSGFRDVYTGEKLNMLKVDMEHLIPAGVAGANANIGNNWSLTNSRINRGKGENSPDYLLTSNKAGWFNTGTTKQQQASGKNLITFDSSGKLTPQGLALHNTREGNIQMRKDVEEKILAKAIDPRAAMAAIAALPTNVLSASDRSGLVGKIVSSYTNASRTVAIGIQSKKEGSLRTVPKPHYWFGKDIGGAKLGKALGDKVVELYNSGNTAGLLKMGAIMANAQKSLLALNEVEYKGNKIRETEYASKTGLPDFLKPKFTAIQNDVLKQVNEL